MKSLRKLLALCAFIVVCFIAAPSAMAGDDITGTWKCEGPGYTGIVKITKEGEAYRVSWAIGNERYTGVGLIEDEVFSVAYYGAKMQGIVAYKIKSGGLFGRWSTNKNPGAVSTEILSR